MKSFKIILICFLILLFLSSCLNSDTDAGYTGILANADVVSSIKRELEDKENSLLASQDDVFWTPSGSLWHFSHECSYLSNSKTIYHGSVEEARLAGKVKACERCAEGTSQSIYDQIDKNEIQSGDVFFIKDGAHWHTNINCKHILGADHIYHGGIDIARILGKQSACPDCGQ